MIKGDCFNIIYLNEKRRQFCQKYFITETIKNKKGDIMKLVIAIVSNKDLPKVLAATSAEGFFSTKISTAGLFLENGQTTILFGVNDDRVDCLFEIIEKNVTKRVIRQKGVESTIEGSLLKKPVDVEEFGAVGFVIDVEEFRKL